MARSRWPWIETALFSIGMVEEVQVQESESKVEREEQERRPSRARRPLRVTLIAILVLIIASIHIIRFIKTIYLWDFLVSLPGISPLYLAFTGLFWAIIGLPLFWWLWRGHPSSPTITRITALAYSFYYWLDRTFIASAPAEHANWPFAAGMTVLLLFYIWRTFSRPGSNLFFRRGRREAGRIEKQEAE